MISMDVDGGEPPCDLSLYDIYTDEDFPYFVRNFIHPVLVELKLYDICLDLESNEPEVKSRVDAICDGAFEKIINTNSDCGLNYQIKQFLRRFQDGRSFFIKLTERLDIERSFMQKKEIREEYMKIKNKKMEISDSITQMMRDWEMMSNQTDDFCSRLEDCSYNVQTIAKHAVHVNEDTRVKVEKHRKDTRQHACQFQANVTMFLTSLNKNIFTIPQNISDFVEIVHRSLRTLRTHFRKELPHFLALSETCFTGLKESLEQFSATIEQFIEKLRQIRLQLKIETVDLHPLYDAIQILLKNGLVVSLEPSFSLRCLKKERRNAYELRYLNTKVGLKATKIHAFLLNDTSLRYFKECVYKGRTLTREMIKDEYLGGTLKGDVAPLENDPVKKVVKCSFKDLTITRASRKHKQNEAVTEQKHVILFIGEVLIDNVKIPVHCFSLPVIIVVHGSQITKSLAAIFWNDNFPVDAQLNLEMQSYVTWPEMDIAIRGLFRKELVHEPTKSNMEYLRVRLYNDNDHNLNITFDMFARQMSHQKQKHTFWDWLWGTIQLLSSDEHLLKLWQSGYIVGYIQANDARTILTQQRMGTDLPLGHKDAERLFLIRFSESQKELITVQGHLHDARKGWGVFSVDPYKIQDLKSISLSQRILDRPDCQTLLFEKGFIENGIPIEQWTKERKENIFQPIPKIDEGDMNLGDGYISWTLKERTDSAKFEGSGESYRVEIPYDFDANSPGDVVDNNVDMNTLLGIMNSDLPFNFDDPQIPNSAAMSTELQSMQLQMHVANFQPSNIATSNISTM